MSVFDGVDLPDADAFAADRRRREDRDRVRAESWLAWVTLAELELLREHLLESIADDPPGWAPDVVARLELLQCRAGRRRGAGVRPWRLSECALHGMHLGCCSHQVWLVEFGRVRDLCVGGVAGCRCVEWVLDDLSVDPSALLVAAAGRCLGRRVPRVDPVAVEGDVVADDVADEPSVVDVFVEVAGPVPRARPGLSGVGGGVLLIPGVDPDPVDLIASLSRSAVAGYRGE